MASPYLHEDAVMQIPTQLTLRDGPEVLSKYKWCNRVLQDGCQNRANAYVVCEYNVLEG